MVGSARPGIKITLYYTHREGTTAAVKVSWGIDAIHLTSIVVPTLFLRLVVLLANAGA